MRSSFSGTGVLRRIALPLVAGLVLAAGLFAAAFATYAAVAPSPCPGNVCTGAVTVGGQTLTYSYTQHVSPTGRFKVRFNGGAYTTTSQISFLLANLPQYASTGVYANPAVFPDDVLPELNQNAGRTSVESKDPDGCSGCIVDEVVYANYTGLAPGQYDFDLHVFQHDATNVPITLTFFVDAAAPSGYDESEAWTAIPDMDVPCADGVDNDISYWGDCADPQCVGEIGRVGDGARCESPEQTCYDGFDNDANGLVDCQDPSCDGRVGDAFTGALCQYGNEHGSGFCTDGFDNDGDGRTDCLDNVSSPAGDPSNTCWKQAAYGCPATEISCTDSIDNDKDKSYDQSYDTAPLTGRDCADYDCAGNSACPAVENRTSPDSGSLAADQQCFDGIDNDLDGNIDCFDSDCLGVVNPSNPNQVCLQKEFDLAQGYQYCGNAFDDDGDGYADCEDGLSPTDCKRAFGNCGPCPSVEDITYDACADLRDNDTDGGANCADPDGDCTGKLGSITNAAMCQTSESGSFACFDGFDNDADGLVDCADPGCFGVSGDGIYAPADRQCAGAENTGALCTDRYDNDVDVGYSGEPASHIDCRDANCWGVAGSGCAPKNWSNAACIAVPSSTPLTGFTDPPSVLVSVMDKAHVDDVHTIAIQGSSSYSSFTLVVGDNNDENGLYPYASATNCTLSGPGSEHMGITAVDGRALQIYDTLGGSGTIDGFSVLLTCVTPSEPADAVSYPVSLSALKEPGGVPEFGDLTFSTRLYEATDPQLLEVEVGGEYAGTVDGSPAQVVDTPLGGSVGFRMAVNEPGSGLYQSGVCGCSLNLGGVSWYDTVNGDCAIDMTGFYKDEEYFLQGRATDGADNTGDPNAARSVHVNVTPIVSQELVVTPSKPFVDTARNEFGVNVQFQTSATGSFDLLTCEVYLRPSANPSTWVNGPGGPSYTFMGVPDGTKLNCDGALSIAPPATAGIPDGQYFVTVRAVDEDLDAVESNRKPLYKCDSVPGPTGAGPGESPDCAFADFDGDGAAEGLWTVLYSTTPQACDNCLNLSNPLQTDVNANGIGDACEPTEEFGRCNTDRNLVCLYDATDPMCTGSNPDEMCCPAPAVADDSVTDQQCRTPWGICSVDGAICFDDGECTDGGSAGGGYGLCAGDASTLCKRDVDCAGGATGPCQDANLCDNLVFPWLETRNGNIFSQSRILAADTPPADKYNATYCISSNDTVHNFTSELCYAEANSSASYEIPSPENSYSGVLGRIDVDGLKAGRYGTATVVPAADVDSELSGIQNPLSGKVIVVEGGDVHVSSPKTFYNAIGALGSGTVLIEGGDLYLDANMFYGGSGVSRLSELAALGWIVIPDENGVGGNVYVHGDVTDIVGNFYVGGSSGFHSVTPSTDPGKPLTVEGLIIARRFELDRGLRSLDRGAEQVIYDGRAVANPPPGFGDIGRSLPSYGTDK